jgi:WD40 repeat protein
MGHGIGQHRARSPHRPGRPRGLRQILSLLGRGAQDTETTDYDGFLSYSHALDGTLAPALQAGLEQFGRPWHQRRVLRVFRDNANLSATPHLWSSIEDALSRSAWLILLASPEASVSPWVDRELAWWLTHRSPDRLLIGLTAGELDWGRPRTAINVLPPALKDHNLPEPRWIDFRKVRAAHRSDPEFQLAVAELAAPLHGVPKDNLVGEQVRQDRIRRRWVRSVAATLATLTLLAASGAGVAWVQRNLAVAAEHAAISRVMVNEADQVRANDPRAALRLGLAAIAVDASSASKASLVQTLTGDPAYRGTMPSPKFSDAFFATDSPILTTINTVSISRWDVRDLSRPRLLTHVDVLPDDGVSSIVSNAAGTLVAATSYSASENEVSLWDLHNPDQAVQIGQPFVARAGDDFVRIVLSPDGRRMAATGGGISDPTKTTVLWNLSDPEHPQQMGSGLTAAKADGEPAVTFSPDGRSMIIVDDDDQHSARIWDVADDHDLRPLGPRTPLNTSGDVGILYSPDGRTVAIWSRGTASLWDTTDGMTIRNPVAIPFAVASIAAFSPNGGAVVAIESDHKTIVISDVDATRTVQPTQLLAGHTNSVYATAWLPGSQTLASGSLDGSVILWDVARSDQPRALGNPLTGHSAGIGGLAFSPDGETLASAGIRIDNSILLWDVGDPDRPTTMTKALNRSPGDPETYSASVTFTTDGRTIAMADNDREHVVDLWDVTDRRNPVPLGQPLDGNTGDVTSVKFSQDGRLLAAASGKNVLLWATDDPRQPRLLTKLETGHNDRIVALALTADAHTMVTVGQDETLVVWDMSDPSRPMQINRLTTPHSNALSTAALSADGRVFATGGADNIVQLWDLTDPTHPQLRGQPLVGNDMIESLAFAPDGETLASGDVRGRTQLWDITDPTQGRPLGDALPGRPATEYGSGAYALAFSPNSNLLAVGDYDGTTVLWDLAPLGALRANATAVGCGREGQPLDKTAWSTIAPDIPYLDPCAAL